MDVRKLLAWAEGRLRRREGVPEPRREARWLLAAVLGRPEAWLVAHDDESVPTEAESRFRAWVERRAAGEPAEHLTGRCTFWGREFRLTPEVLIPRPETELLVERALALELPAGSAVLDVGTGSGCIAVTLAMERPQWRVAAVDRHSEALAVAGANAAAFGAGIALVQGDLAGALGAGWRLVTANLPYVPSAAMASLPVEVQREPASALDGGPDGLDLIRALLEDLPRLLAPKGAALLELYEGQAGLLRQLVGDLELEIVWTGRDVAACERVVEIARARC